MTESLEMRVENLFFIFFEAFSVPSNYPTIRPFSLTPLHGRVKSISTRRASFAMLQGRCRKRHQEVHKAPRSSSNRRCTWEKKIFAGKGERYSRERKSSSRSFHCCKIMVCDIRSMGFRHNHLICTFVGTSKCADITIKWSATFHGHHVDSHSTQLIHFKHSEASVKRFNLWWARATFFLLF